MKLAIQRIWQVTTVTFPARRAIDRLQRGGHPQG